MKIHALSIFLLILTLSSCVRKTKNELLVGRWTDVEGSVIDEYRADKTYHTDFKDHKTDDGQWRIMGNKLYVTVPGSADEVRYEITALTEEKLVLLYDDILQTTYQRMK